MPSYPDIDRYYAEKQRLIDFSGSDHEQNIRRAFAICRDSYCRDHRDKLAPVDELEARTNPEVRTDKESISSDLFFSWACEGCRSDLRRRTSGQRLEIAGRATARRAMGLMRGWNVLGARRHRT